MIRVEGISKRYGPIVAVDELSFEVVPGETFALIGPNGAGKTTTLKMMLGLARPDRGSIALGPDRLAPHDPRARERLGYVPQRVEFPPTRTALDILDYFASLRGLPAGAAARALERVGLSDVARRRASELSGGYAQRLSLAQALLGDPSLLVLDEPTASLDPEATWEFRSLVERLRREGTTILLCSHLLAEVERVADRVLILLHGRRAALESLSALRERQVNATRLVIEFRDDAARGRERLAAAGYACETLDSKRLVVDGAGGRGVSALEILRDGDIAIHSFELSRPTLEELFLAVVRQERGHD
ncbi:MAG TPA: ABC transporter ATP-binding protein [Candidatus Eisenbacteria bacterium]|nr:ABC transporter ATP-binding protein [Candidatus Eisenbacteria bacterium]